MIVKTYYYECSDPKLADDFLKVISNMDVPIENIYIVSKEVDFSQISFRCNRKKRILIEYVYREYENLSRRYLWNLDDEQNNPYEKTFYDDGYVIY